MRYSKAIQWILLTTGWVVFVSFQASAINAQVNLQAYDLSVQELEPPPIYTTPIAGKWTEWNGTDALNETIPPVLPLDVITREVYLRWEDLVSQDAVGLHVRFQRQGWGYLGFAFKGDPDPFNTSLTWESLQCYQFPHETEGDTFVLEAVTQQSDNSDKLNATFRRTGHRKEGKEEEEEAAAASQTFVVEVTRSEHTVDPTYTQLRMLWHESHCQPMSLWPIQLVLASRPSYISVQEVIVHSKEPWVTLYPTAWKSDPNCIRHGVYQPTPHPWSDETDYHERWTLHKSAAVGSFFSGKEAVLSRASYLDMNFVAPVSLTGKDRDVPQVRSHQEGVPIRRRRRFTVSFPPQATPGKSFSWYYLQMNGVRYQGWFRGHLRFPLETNKTLPVTGVGEVSYATHAVMHLRHTSLTDDDQFFNCPSETWEKTLQI